MTRPAQPTWLVPAVPGSVSNWGEGGRIPLDSATMLRFTALYSSPGDPSDTAGQIRVTGQRVATASLGYGGVGGALAPVWDSGWIGSATVSQYPDFNGLNSFGMAYSSNRIYITGGSNGGEGVLNNVWSAPFNGGSVGSWRPETPLPVYCRMHCCVIIGGFLHVISGQQTAYARYAGANLADASPHCWVAPILGDGVVGGWQLQKLDLTAARCYAHAIQAGNYNNPADPNWGLPILMVSGGATTDGGGTAQAQTFATTINTDGSFQGWVAEQSLLAARYGHYSLYDDSSGKMWVFGGTSGSAALNSIEVATWNTATRVMGAWANNGTLPAVRAGMAGAYVPGWESAAKNGRVALLGGTQAAVLPATTSLSNTIIYGGVPSAGSVSWNVSSQTLPEAVNCLGAAAVLEATAGGYSNGMWEVAALGGRIATGGVTGSGSTRTTVSLKAPPPVSTTDFVLTSAIGTALTAGTLGTDGALVTRTTGDQEWTFDYNFSTSQVAIVDPLLAGDEVEFSVQFLGNQSGNPSPIAYTTVKIGPGPYIPLTSVVPSGTISTGQPTASFTCQRFYGLQQATWQLVVKDNVGRTVFDTGIRPDLDNSAPVNTAPLLQSGVSYTFTVTVTTKATAIDARSSTSATVVTTVTPSYTAPAVPT